MGDAALLAVLRRDRALLLSALGAIAVLAWGYTFYLAGSMEMAAPMSMPSKAEMPGMMMPGVKAWSLPDFLFIFTMWVIMMIAMMTPSAAPMVLIYARVGRQAAEQGRPLAATAWFFAGYLLAWIGFSLAATLGQWALSQAALLTLDMALSDRLLGSAVLIVAGLYQLSPLKNTCLQHCQTPLTFIQHHGGFRREPTAAVRLGLGHGLYCIGCCWALMVLLFVGGIMNLLWIAALTVLVLAEKVIPAGRMVSSAVGLLLIGSGTWLLVTH